MEPSTILFALALLACPLAMGAMMWMMSKQQMGGESTAGVDDNRAHAPMAERLAALKAQREALEAEIAEVRQLVELEAERNTLLAGRAHQVDNDML